MVGPIAATEMLVLSTVDTLSGGAITAAGGAVVGGAWKLGTEFAEEMGGVRKPRVQAGGACSFTADTGVLMADGSVKKIAEVNIGDKVRATDAESGKTEPEVVTKLWVHDDTVVDLEVGGQRVTTTEDNRFWNVTDQKWQEAQDLDSGDLLLSADGSTTPAGGLEWVSACVAPAYTLTVVGIHTYYVLAGDTPVLVHNCPTEDAFSGHALGRLAQRGVTQAQAAKVLDREPFPYWHDGQWKTGYYDPSSKIFIGKTIDGNINTVMTNVDKAYVSRLQNARP